MSDLYIDRPFSNEVKPCGFCDRCSALSDLKEVCGDDIFYEDMFI